MAFHISTEERLFFTAECFYYCGNVILENYFYWRAMATSLLNPLSSAAQLMPPTYFSDWHLKKGPLTHLSSTSDSQIVTQD